MTIIEQIKAEIERRMLEDYNSGNEEQDAVAQGVCAGLLTFIDSLQTATKTAEQHISMPRNIGKSVSVLNAVAYLSQLGYTCVPPTVEEDFEAEWKRYMASKKDDLSGSAVSVNVKDVARHFAEWQMARDKKTIEVAEDHAMLAGRMKMKGEMMNGAVQAEVGYFTKAGLFFLEGSLSRHGLKEGDKVKLIIIKDDDSNKH